MPDDRSVVPNRPPRCEHCGWYRTVLGDRVGKPARKIIDQPLVGAAKHPRAVALRNVRTGRAECIAERLRCIRPRRRAKTLVSPLMRVERGRHGGVGRMRRRPCLYAVVGEHGVERRPPRRHRLRERRDEIGRAEIEKRRCGDEIGFRPECRVEVLRQVRLPEGNGEPLAFFLEFQRFACHLHALRPQHQPFARHSQQPCVIVDQRPALRCR